MPADKTTKEKILAVMSVILLFAVVGTTLWLVSVGNRNRTLALQAKVREIKAQQERERIGRENLARLTVSASTTPETTAQAFLVLAVANGGQEKVLLQKNPGWALPIASVTKLMTAIIAMENAGLGDTVTATLDYIGREESAFILETGKEYTAQELLANALISSDNDSARLLSGLVGGETPFVEKMNEKVRTLGLLKTQYFNVTGLDPAASSTQNANLSSPEDLARIALYFQAHYPNLLALTTEKTHQVCDVAGYCKEVKSTDKLLDNPAFPFKIIGGKTGSTDLALKNLVLLSEPFPGVTIVSVVLGAQDNFADTLSLINSITIAK